MFCRCHVNSTGTRQYTHNDTASWPATSPHKGKFGSALWSQDAFLVKERIPYAEALKV